MNAPTKIGAFLAGLAAVFGLALVLGSQVGSVGEPAAAAHGTGHGSAHDTVHDPDPATTAGEGPGGLAVSQDGYTLRLARASLPAEAGATLRLVIEGPDGKPVTAYDVQHDKLLHLIVVRRDFSGFQHVHPVLENDGTWSAPVDLTAGAWRVFADFKPTSGEALTLGADLSVSGTPEPATEQPVTRTATVEGYTVTLTGDLVVGEDSMVELDVAKDGQPVTDLQPYLGAYGHLVALREGDLAYLHVHPDGEPGDATTSPGPVIRFGAEVPSSGRYHLYLDFRHDGVVRTAQFALDAATEANSSSD
ncbi:MAG: hypothetical protein ABIN79_02805 [Marmoricola sp.]